MGWDAETALHRWLLVFGPAPLDTYLMAFGRREIAKRGSEVAGQWQRTLVGLLETSLRTSWPVSRVDGLKQIEQIRWIRNSEEALIACLNACARVSRTLSSPSWPQLTSFGEMLKRLQGQRTGPANSLVMECLSFWDCERAFLDMADLYAANLEQTKLAHAALHFANLSRSNLDGADLRGAEFLHTNLIDASLTGTLLLASDVCRSGSESEDEKVFLTRRRTKRQLKSQIHQFTRVGAHIVDDVGEPVGQPS